MDDPVADVEVHPGDVVHVADDGGDVHDDDSVSIDDFSTTVDESVNVIVNVEQPEPVAEESAPPWAEELIARVAAIEALQVVDVLMDVVEDPAPVVNEPEADAIDVIDVEEEAPPEAPVEPSEESGKKGKNGYRRFGR